MHKRAWQVQWRAHPRSDSRERLARAVQLLLDRAGPAPSEHATERPTDADDPPAVGQTAKERP
jgi:hypothetical protein